MTKNKNKNKKQNKKKKNETKQFTIGSVFYSEISKLLKFVIFLKLVKIDIFNEKQNKHNSKCMRSILKRFFNFTFS